MKKAPLHDLIEMLKKIESTDDFPDSYFDEMINATIAGTMASLVRKGMKESDALAMMHKSINKHFDEIMKDFR